VLSYLLAPEQGELQLMLLAALAANKLLEELEFDVAPELRLPTGPGTTLCLDLVEIKSNPTGAEY